MSGFEQQQKEVGWKSGKEATTRVGAIECLVPERLRRGDVKEPSNKKMTTSVGDNQTAVSDMLGGECSSLEWLVGAQDAPRSSEVELQTPQEDTKTANKNSSI